MDINSISDIFNVGVWSIAFLILILQLLRSLFFVPTKNAYIVERFGKYLRTLEPGFHAIIPFIDKVVDKVNLKEMTIDVPPQYCFSKDEINLQVDGVIYMSVEDPSKASYGIVDYHDAAVQLARTTTRSVIGTLDLERTFEERDLVSSKVVEVLNSAGQSWGIRVHRFEIKNILPPISVNEAMERQVTAERNRRAILAKSLGDKQARINISEGVMTETINVSEGDKQQLINEAEGKAQEILTIAKATAESIQKIGKAINEEGGEESIRLQLAEKLFSKVGTLGDAKTRVVLPANVADFQGWLKMTDLEMLPDNK
ncbi:stomatin-like protein [Reinekea marina]|uniref:SPFH domain-containing protein n=1 Tax=Reinekea marina TaxID=1310421 RepID=A0ABV7WRG1_9GAMM|nr:stomatin-like protein [Reinekea marina]MDN3647795.1 stomatin-like protein [Reinekea marina]